ncbi:MAG: hypothetical protein PHX87_04830 [Candidatus Peribacteraceae bacterium]|nr:hypothetical protein [Candidatus Peribacteraceae bacterium]MDD5742721.1 hypothetical protein [Candidatus Peribacteraceae bacterium]
MSTVEKPIDPPGESDFSVFDGFDVPSFVKAHNGIPEVAATSQESIRNRLRAIQAQMIENDPLLQTILAGIVQVEYSRMSGLQSGKTFKSNLETMMSPMTAE